MSISISNLLELISYDKVVSITVSSIVLLLVWFKLGGSNDNDKNKEHDEKLFKQPPPREDCPICFLRLPSLHSGTRYYDCCGKVICGGCSFAPLYDNLGNEVDIDDRKCPFCRTPEVSDEEEAESYKKRIEADDPIAIHKFGCFYSTGMHGYPQDHAKALEYWHRAGELGYATAYLNIGTAYYRGQGVEVDKKKAIHYYELAAMRGDMVARYNLGNNEACVERALKHHMIAVRGGHSNSLKEIKELYKYELATKEDYTKALRAYQDYLGEIKSDQRDEAAAADEEFRYY